MINRYLLPFLWVLYAGFVGPWLVSAPSDVAVIAGIAIGGGLSLFTFHRLMKSTSKESNQ